MSSKYQKKDIHEYDIHEYDNKVHYHNKVISYETLNDCYENVHQTCEILTCN